jgi:hypothetical protein
MCVSLPEIILNNQMLICIQVAVNGLALFLYAKYGIICAPYQGKNHTCADTDIGVLNLVETRF